MAITEIEDKISKIIDNDDHDNFIYDFLRDCQFFCVNKSFRLIDSLTVF